MEKPLDSQTSSPGIDLGDHQITIHHKATPLFIRIVLISILLVCAILPIVGSIAVLASIGPHFGLLLLFLFFWGFGFMLLRVVLWNSYGREILYLWENKIEYIADYKYFKDARQEIKSKGLRVEIFFENEKEPNSARLRLENDSLKIETVLQTNIDEIERVKYKLKERYSA